MKLKTLLAPLPTSKITGTESVNIAGVAVDSRKIQPGFCYIAIPGTHVDGADFIPDAIRQGASAIVSEKAAPPTLASQVAWVQIPNAHVAAALLAASWYRFPSRYLKTVGVTGTNGKTTTTFLLQHIFRKYWHRAGLIGTVTYDNGATRTPSQQTTPGPLDTASMLNDMLNHGCRAVALEVSSHALTQYRTVGIEFDVGIFTNLTQDHLDYHHTMEEYFQAKSDFFRQIIQGPGKKKPIALINIDDEYGRKLTEMFASSLTIKTFGSSLQCDFRMIPHHMSPKGSEIELVYKNKSYLIRIPLIGRFNLYNALGALAGAVCVGIPIRDSIAALASCHQIPGRMELAGIKENVHIFIDYAHTPDALANACKTLKDLGSGKLITVFGCGGDRDRTKRPLMGKIAAQYSDSCIVTSDNPRSEDPEAIIRDILSGMPSSKIQTISDRKEAIRTAIEQAAKNDIVLIAGKGHETYQEVADGRIDFNDFTQVRQALAHWSHQNQQNYLQKPFHGKTDRS